MGGKTIANSSILPTKLYLSRIPLQKAAVTINALAHSQFLTHFPGISPEDISYANRIVQGLPSNIGFNTHTFAFPMSTPMSLASSEEFTEYAALQDGVTAGAVLKHWKMVKAFRELDAQTPIARGAGDCVEVWDSLERCWGRKVAEDAWFDYINGDTKGGGGGGGEASGSHEVSADSWDSGGPRERPWKRAGSGLVGIDSGVDRSGGNEAPRERSKGPTGHYSMSIDEVVGNSGGSEGPRKKSGKRVRPDQTPATPARGPPPAPPHTRGQRPHSLGRTFRPAYSMKYTNTARSKSYPDTARAGPKKDPLGPEDDM